MTNPRTVAILALPGVQLLDVSGPLDVFAEANVPAQREVYRPLPVASKGGAIRSSSGTRLWPDQIIGTPLLSLTQRGHRLLCQDQVDFWRFL